MKLEWNSCLRAGVTVVLTYLVIHYWSVVSQMGRIALGAAVPLLLGCVIAYILNIPMCFFEKQLHLDKHPGLKRTLCLCLSIACILLVMGLVVGMVVPELVACLKLLWERLPGVLTNLFTWLEANFNYQVPPEFFPSNWSTADWESLLSTAGDWLVSGIGGTMSSLAGALSSTLSGVITLALALVFSLYLLANKDSLLHQLRTLVRTYLGEPVLRKVSYVLDTANTTFHSFVVGQCVEAVILGGLCIVGMWLLRFPYATMIGTLIGFTALIPIAGAYIGAAVGALMILTNSPLQAIFFIIFLVLLQQLEGNLIYPRVVGSTIGLPGLWVMAAVTVGGGVMGIPGMLLGVPLAATLYKLVRSDVLRRNAPPAPPAEENVSG